MLPNHLRDTHGATADVYRAAYRLPHGVTGAHLYQERSRGLKQRLAELMELMKRLCQALATELATLESHAASTEIGDSDLAKRSSACRC